MEAKIKEKHKNDSKFEDFFDRFLDAFWEGFGSQNGRKINAKTNSQKCPEAMEFFIQVSVPLRNLYKVMQGALSFSRCWR